MIYYGIPFDWNIPNMSPELYNLMVYISVCIMMLLVRGVPGAGQALPCFRKSGVWANSKGCEISKKMSWIDNG